MKRLQNQVCSYAISKELSKFQITLKPCFYWYTKNVSSDPILINYKSKFVLEKDKIYSAFTVSELGELLLDIVNDYSVYIFPKFYSDSIEYKLYNGNDEFGSCEAGTEAELRARMLLRALTCKHIE